MYLQQLRVYQFRNLDTAELNWNRSFNVIWGQNGQGKTNVLEAIYLLAHLKSFRQSRSGELIRFGEEQAQLAGKVEQQDGICNLQLRLDREGKKPTVNGKSVSRPADFLGKLRVVLFTPEEMVIIRGYPAGRRALLDRAVLQTDAAYLVRYQDYARILKQRNSLLKTGASDALLQPWTTALIQAGSRLRHDRQQFLERFQPTLQHIYRDICGGREQVDLRYSVAPKGEQQLQEELTEECRKNLLREKSLGQTLCGPHRDDLEPQLDGRSLRSFGSQGQQRSFLLAFRAAQVIDLQRQFGSPPVLLLDDLASELDTQRQTGFIEFLHRQSGQVFLSTATSAGISKIAPEETNYYRVADGKVVVCQP
ncbi:MAG: DNA replication/repair protein RecF [Desulfuromonadales bacterium]|nr:DNA replication/repair protein RecF [Desulfuromonadales bacterium]